MPGKIHTWPAWAEYIPNKDSYHPQDPDFQACKEAILEEYGRDALEVSWRQVCQDLEVVASDIASKKSSCIPIFESKDVLDAGFDRDQIEQIKLYGCCIVRQVVPENTAKELYQKLKTYIANNKPQIQGWPAESPSMLLLYDSPTQIGVRTHPNHLKLQRSLNQLWHEDDGDSDKSQAHAEPLLYSDGVRDRPPMQPFLGLGPHIDAGSLCRWADPGYRKVYNRIWSGNPREHDAFDLSTRQHANQYLFPGIAHSTVLRSFQGWTALTPTAPGQGTILLYPNISTVMAYLLLRPFFKQPPTEEDVLDASKWTFDAENAWFPGTFKEQSQRLSRMSHPHLRLEDCLVHVPPLKPGDTVWWHADVCHAVDPDHNGDESACVTYVAACPSTATNKAYIKSQLEYTLAGKPPPDYADGLKLDETRFSGYTGHQGLKDEARAALGYYL
ncbi:hypothetical protein LTR10_014619 [Elasticomyces elasticus]|uniref:DUF1479 domain protein n=1 Tax=Exophiala sideris TaxID=1016849 RepID=A0ABR0JT30_9EURO|nr:hypothetical protein LTR10_014619 [Elasticomyces elasticus]KAK5040596.1 hypothetical protein LTS07_001096 [Exophiala sideris]KAK5042979.1 hypothetical protein LTR13_000749 [Exophiala sideris]KAK5068974.1 hypothetical protein LTR69_001097 [Exophiala sideris]KAK5186571.1 hypothetical protein LTR44_001628 [Eurotiomycetes sp. CCFEE 6388]